MAGAAATAADETNIFIIDLRLIRAPAAWAVQFTDPAGGSGAPMEA
jgi:hypothetical protein